MNKLLLFLALITLSLTTQSCRNIAKGETPYMVVTQEQKDTIPTSVIYAEIKALKAQTISCIKKDSQIIVRNENKIKKIKERSICRIICE
jgi:hypothetical protein